MKQSKASGKLLLENGRLADNLYGTFPRPYLHTHTADDARTRESMSTAIDYHDKDPCWWNIFWHTTMVYIKLAGLLELEGREIPLRMA